MCRNAYKNVRTAITGHLEIRKVSLSPHSKDKQHQVKREREREKKRSIIFLDPQKRSCVWSGLRPPCACQQSRIDRMFQIYPIQENVGLRKADAMFISSGFTSICTTEARFCVRNCPVLPYMVSISTTLSLMFDWKSFLSLLVSSVLLLFISLIWDQPVFWSRAERTDN